MAGMTTYSIADVSSMMGISAYTLRYYEKIGLLSFVKRDINGVREFEDKDVLTLNTVRCLKDTGMPLKDIKHYLELVGDGLDSAEERRDMFAEQKTRVEQEISDLQQALETIKTKLHYYQEAVDRQRLDVCQDERAELLHKILSENK
ncbi:putative HTH-type transcriptional regulator [Bombiscardovia nodaiensis]|uniref:HTH-type transcriptional regulator n=1 Tax=Bombiscardovia nodaiensis TaxID=2932181 RepID=A0ABM8B6P3_9BIFI|nr:putative HTH-type transcriptional regulator [Bombiscardovia nodaiensis]